MESKTKNKISYGLKLTGLIVVIAVLSGCHALPIHHGYSHGHSSSGYYDNDSHRSRHSRSRDY